MCQGRCVTFLKNIRDVILGKKYFLTGRRLWKMVRLVEVIILFYLVLQAAIFLIHRLVFKTHFTEAHLWSRRLYGIGLLFLNSFRVLMIHKALKSTKQPMKMQNYLKYYYRLCWMQFVYVYAVGIYTYYYEYFFKNHWTFQTYFAAFVLILIMIVLRAALWHVQYQIRRIDSPMMQKLREHIQIMKQDQELTTELSKETEPTRSPVQVDVETTNCDFDVPFHLMERYMISPLDIITSDKHPIGEGMFGIVLKGMLLIDGVRRDVILKAAKNPENPDMFQMLLQEIKIIIHVGDHPNIIKCFGVTSETTLNYHLAVVNDYCVNGDLENFLENQRDNFESNHSHQNSEARVGCLLELKHLFKFTSEICSGMEHLAAKKVVHGDLATRNVLLSNNLQVKITDFGMSRRLYNYQQYSHLQQEAFLPWRWMSIEAIEDLKLSEKSDVWSYGVTIWEIFTLGEFPYHELVWKLDIPQKLRSGLRLGKPPWANEQMYEVMQSCWKAECKQRPNFQQLRHQIQILQHLPR